MIKKILIAIISVIATFIMAIIGMTIFLATDYGQEWLYEKGLKSLAEILQTRVDVKHISVNLWNGKVALYGMEIDDRKAVTMLRVDTLEADFDLSDIFDREIGIEGVKLAGADLVLYKERPDTLTNYQFLFDALKKDRKRKKTKKEKKEPYIRFVLDIIHAEISRTSLKWDVYSRPPRGGDTLDTSHLNVKDFRVSLKGSLLGTRLTNAGHSAPNLDITLSRLHARELKSKTTLDAGTLSYRTHKDNTSISIENMACSYMDKLISCKRMEVQQKAENIHTDRDMTLSIDALTYYCNNGKPRKNAGRPNRGWFDKGHLDVTMSMQATLHHATKDSINADITRLTATDKGSGLYIKNATANVNIHGKDICVSNLNIALKHSRIKAKNITLHYKTFPNREKPNRVSVDIDNTTVTAYVILQDIARPFAPRLENFTTPLTLRVNVDGNLDRIVFSNIRIATPDRRLTLTAEGDLCKVLDKQRLCLHFDNITLHARDSIKEQIVNHFADSLNLKMTNQLKAIGDIGYKGTLGIFHRREDIAGTLYTHYGNVKFAFTLNGDTKYMTGIMSTDSINIGSILNINGLSISRSKASYSFNISRRRGGHNNGRLPQGWLKADVANARCRMLKFNSIHTDMTSDGREAVGSVRAKQKHFDFDADFIYRQTATEQSFRIHPHMTVHAFSEEARRRREVKRAAKERIREERKLMKSMLKAEREAAKEARRAEREARRAETAKQEADSQQEVTVATQQKMTTR